MASVSRTYPSKPLVVGSVRGMEPAPHRSVTRRVQLRSVSDVLALDVLEPLGDCGGDGRSYGLVRVRLDERMNDGHPS